MGLIAILLTSDENGQKNFRFFQFTTIGGSCQSRISREAQKRPSADKSRGAGEGRLFLIQKLVVQLPRTEDCVEFCDADGQNVARFDIERGIADEIQVFARPAVKAKSGIRMYGVDGKAHDFADDVFAAVQRSLKIRRGFVINGVGIGGLSRRGRGSRRGGGGRARCVQSR